MQCMAAQEGSEASVASSPLPPPPPSSASSSWWRDMHPYSSWPPPAAPRWAPPQPQSSHHHHTSSSGADDDLSASNATMTSFTNTSTNHSGLSIDSSGPNAAAAVATESHLWNQVLMGTAGGEVERSMQVHDARDDSENFLELLNSRTLAPELFAEPPACDYLKKMEYGSGNQPSSAGTWPDVHHFNTSATALQKHLSSSGYAAAVPERLTANLSDLVSNWSLAPPCDNPPAEAMGGHVKHEMEHNASICHGVMMEAGGGTTAMGLGYSSMLGLSNRMFGGGGGGGGGGAFMDLPWSNNAGPARTLTDLISFGGPLGKAVVAPAKTGASEYKKQGQEISSPVKTSSSSKGSATTSEGKKKRSDQEHGAEGNLKKSKHETSSPTSSLKSQVPKVKLGDKITALQQIVSPFGKTDTASVLYEAINYIKWLHEQVQLLSDPYMKSSSSKDYNAWGGLERKEKAETEADLRSRGLCLVPVSCTPQVYRDNTGPDYWTPPYRSCLYR